MIRLNSIMSHGSTSASENHKALNHGKMPISELGLVDPITRYLRYPLVKKAVKQVRKLPVTPNQITLIHTFFGLGAAYLVYQEQYLGAIAAYEIRNILDVADGVLARKKHLTTQLGRTWDTLSDGLSFNALMLAGALRLVNDFSRVDTYLILGLVLFFAVTAAQCGTVYQLMRRKMGSIINKEVDQVESEWREIYLKTKSKKANWIEQIGFWLDSQTIKFVSKEWYQKLKKRKDSENWKALAIRDAEIMNELACVTRRKEFKRAVHSISMVSDDNIFALMSLCFLTTTFFPGMVFPYVHPVAIAFSVGLVFALISLAIGLHYLHVFLHGVHKE